MQVRGAASSVGESVASTAPPAAAERLQADLHRDARSRPCNGAARRCYGRALSALSLLPDGRVCYELKRAWADGTTHVVMKPEVLIERLVALVPRPRKHLVTYHGVLAPASGLRARVVPRVVKEGAEEGGGAGADVAVDIDNDASCRLLPERGRRSVPHAPGKRWRGEGGSRGARRRYPWAELMRRVFDVDVLLCPGCGGRRKVLAAIHDPASIEKVLAAMGLSSEVPALAAARSPPARGDWWGA